MKTKNKQVTKKIGALTLGALVALGGGVMIGSHAFPQTITEEVIVEKTVKEVIDLTENQTIEAFNAGVASVELPEMPEPVEVDNQNLEVVLKELYDSKGNMSLVVNGLFDDELDVIVDRIVQVNDWKATSINLAKNRLAFELDRQYGFDRRDVSRIKVDEDSVRVSSVDFDRMDAVVEFDVEFRFDGELYVAEVLVEFYDGKALPVLVTAVNQ